MVYDRFNSGLFMIGTLLIEPMIAYYGLFGDIVLLLLLISDYKPLEQITFLCLVLLFMQNVY